METVDRKRETKSYLNLFKKYRRALHTNLILLKKY
jgi:hypothetical protein